MAEVVTAPAWDFAAAPPGMAPGVSSMVGYRAFGIPETLHRGLPSSRLTFIVALDDGVEAAAEEAALPEARPAPVVLGGLHTTASYVQQRSQQAGVQLAVHPLAARSVLGLPAAELPVAEFDASGLLGRWSLDLREQLAGAADWQQRFHLVSQQLITTHARHEHHAGAIRPELVGAWQLLERSGGRARIADIAAAVGLSARHLQTLFVAELGRTPKQIAGLMRFEHATTLVSRQIERTGRVDLAGVAAVAGYSDQAHLSREFTRYLGIGPSAWICEEFRNLQDGGYGAAAQWCHD